MERRTFFFGGAATLVATQPTLSWAETCPTQTTRTQCDPVADRNFTPGSDNRPPNCVLDFSLPDDIYRSIRRSNGTSEWVLRLMTVDASGQPKWTIAHRVDNSQVRRQGVYFGTHVITYITCDAYTGWLTTGPIRSCGTAVFRRVNWNLDYRDLDALQLRQDS